MQNAFGSGALWGVDTGSNPTPVRFGVLQECGVDFTANSKPLFGQNQLPVTVARGAMSVKGKATVGQFVGRMIGKLFFGVDATTGSSIAIDNESQTTSSGNTPTLTVTNTTTFTTDLGVLYAATGIPFVRVSSSPIVGQYSVNTTSGVYTFNASDASTAVKVSYAYTAAATGQTLTITNTPMGQANTFKTVLSMPYASNKANITLNACVSSKLTFDTKLEDFTMPQFDFDAFTDSSDTLGTISIAEKS